MTSEGPPTLVIPAYNRGNLIAQTLDSALTQTRPFAAVIVIDDGSTDNTTKVLANYAQHINIVRTANRGVQAARNTGIEAAATELVTLCDSDDLLQPNYVETVESWMRDHPATDIVYCNFTLFNDQGQQGNKLDSAPVDFLSGAKLYQDFYTAIPDLYQRNLQFQPLFPTGCTFRKKFARRLGGFDTAFNRVGAEDWEFTLRAILQGNLSLCALPLAQVRKHSGNDSSNATYMLRGEIQILEHSLAHHTGAAQYRSAIEDTLNKRRLLVFDAAFADGNFELLAQMLAQIKFRPSSTNFWLKYAISQLPETLRQPLWSLTQR